MRWRKNTAGVTVITAKAEWVNDPLVPTMIPTYKPLGDRAGTGVNANVWTNKVTVTF